MNRISVNNGTRVLQSAMWPVHDVRPATVVAHREAVERVIKMMHDRLDEPLTLQEMSKTAYISPYHFNRIFRQITGIPPNQFFYALRLETAKRLLLTTNTNVTDVCFDVGYNSLGTFIRRFTALVGLSPGHFRSFACHETPGLSEPAANGFDVAAPSGISGKVTAPEWFDGSIFVGLFTTPIPQGPPVSGTVVAQPGTYRFPPVADGVYYLLAAGVASSKDFKEQFLYESTLRGGGQPILICDGVVEGPTDISLRPPEPFDPPILMALPLLLSRINAVVQPAKQARAAAM